MVFPAVPALRFLVLMVALVMVWASPQCQQLESHSLLQRRHEVLTKQELHVRHNDSNLNKALAVVYKLLPQHILRKHELRKWLAAALRAKPSQFKDLISDKASLDGKLFTSAIWNDLVYPKFFGQTASTAWDYHPKLIQKVNQTSNASLCTPTTWLQNRTILWSNLKGEVRPIDIERLGWHKPYAPAHTSYMPSFNVCTRPLAFLGAKSIMFFPGVDDGSEHDCDALQMLMEAVGQKANVPDAAKGVAVDVGASEGMCTLLLLSKGYTVYSYEPQPIFQAWRQMSVDANAGFVSRARLRGGLQGATTLDSELLDAADAPRRVHVLKLDADDAEASILHGGYKLLQSGRVEMVQLELWKSDYRGPCSEKECVVSTAKRKALLLARLESHGYQVYVLRAWGDRAHPQVFTDDGHKCNSLRKQIHQYKDFQEGGSLGSQYRYGDHKVQALGLLPISPVEELRHRKRSRSLKHKLLDCFCQFLAIHKSSPSLDRLHAGALRFLHEDHVTQRLHLHED